MTTSNRPRGLSDLNPDLLRGYARRGLLGEALAWARRHLTGVHSAALSEAYRERDRARERALELDARLLAEQARALELDARLLARSQEAIRLRELLRELAATAATDLRVALERERIRTQEAARLLEAERLEYLRLRDAASLALEWIEEGTAGANGMGIARALRTALRRSERAPQDEAPATISGSKAPEVGRPQGEPWPGAADEEGA